jgi:N-acetylneuraminate lyase
MKKHLFEGLIAAPFTPMDDKGNINLEPVGRYVDHLAGSGVTGAFVCGTTGESPSLTTDERKLVLEEWMKFSSGKLKIICHVGGNSLPQSIELAGHAATVGADATGAFAPFFFKPSSVDDLLDFLAPIAGAAPEIPFYYYNIPSMTGVNLPVVQVLEKAKSRIPNFAGVKYTHFDLYDMQQCIAYGKGEFQIFHGYDEMLLAGLTFGVKAAVGSTYNYMPSVYLKLWEAFNHSDMESARQWQLVSVKAVQILNKYGGGVRAGKAIMELTGISCGPCRRPVAGFTADETASLRTDLEAMDFFSLI